jgi:uncharacterized protein (TIGR02421 family)
VRYFERQLNKIELPNLDVRAATDEVFQGRGYLITHVNSHFDNTLVLPTEVKKVFMDETSGELYPLVLEDLKAGFKQAITETSAYFVRKYGKRKKAHKGDVLSSTLNKEIISLDKKLYTLSRQIETLSYINPVNLASERKRFFSKALPAAPSFKYRQLNINPYQFRESLYKLPVEEVMDADIQQLYRHIIDNLASKIDLLTSIGTDDFVYNSLKYYGEPDTTDLANAEFLLHAPLLEKCEAEQALMAPSFNADQAINYFKEQAAKWQIKCKIEKSGKIVAKAMVNNDKSLLLINKDVQFSEKELQAFAHHELGIHMLTTINAKKQPLKVFSLGLVGNTHAQEGLAIYSEYCSGSLTLERLKILALRVIAVNDMLRKGDFVSTYNMLITEYQLTRKDAFTLATRVYRGGGFTKDYLYLKGFRDIVNLSKQGSLEHLLTGKTGLLDAGVVQEMVVRGLINKPTPLFDLSLPQSGNGQINQEQAILNYLVSAIR